MAEIRLSYSSYQNSAEIGWGFWLRWVLFSLIGFLASLLFVEVGIRPYVGWLPGAIGGTVTGLAQWLALRNTFSGARWWLIISVITWGLLGASDLGALGWIAPRSEILVVRAIVGIIDGAQIGFLLGLGQWLVLRSLPKAHWWILLNSLAWAIGLSCGWTVGGVFYAIAHLFIYEVLGLALAWVVVGGITGVALVGLWRGGLRSGKNFN